MARLYKNVRISMEMHSLNTSVPEIPPSPERVTPMIDESQLEQLQKQAYDQGYALGKSEEHTHMEEEFAQLKKQMQEMLAAIPDAIAQNRLNLHHEIADIVGHISKQFFMDNLNNIPLLTQQINRILTQLNNQHQVELCLHPQELNTLQKGSIQLDASHLNGLKIKADPNLVLGGYLIKTNHGLFDGSIEKQIDKLKTVLLELRHGGQHALPD